MSILITESWLDCTIVTRRPCEWPLTLNLRRFLYFTLNKYTKNYFPFFAVVLRSEHKLSTLRSARYHHSAYRWQCQRPRKSHPRSRFTQSAKHQDHCHFYRRFALCCGQKVERDSECYIFVYLYTATAVFWNLVWLRMAANMLRYLLQKKLWVLP